MLSGLTSITHNEVVTLETRYKASGRNEIFPLWIKQYSIMKGTITVITRLPNSHDLSAADKLKDLPLNAPKLYETNHAPGWLHRPPVWYMKMLASKGLI